MTLEEYFDHYLVPKDMLINLLVAIAMIMVIDLVIIIIARLMTNNLSGKARVTSNYNKAHNYIERFYEMIFSASSILSFLSLYYLIDRFVTEGEFRTFWDAYKDFILLLMIVVSIIVNSYFDRMLIPLKNIERSEKASVRLMGMFYILFIFAYIKYIYENNNYDNFILYFIGLVIGRFVYFDASFRDFLGTLFEALKNFPLLVLGLICTGGMCYYGFGSGYLLKSNGVLVSTFFANLFLIVAIFIVHHTRIMNIFIPNPRRKKKRGEDYSED